MSDDLIALLDGAVIGTVHRRRGRLSFVYEDGWRSQADAYPLSLSMPLAAAEHGHAVVDAYLWGLLPDNANILDRWARRFRVSARNVFGLIAHVGEDCAGAVQFTRPDRLDVVRRDGPGTVAWLDDAAVAERLRDLRGDQSAWRRVDDAGQFSLAGAQPKTALVFESGRWGIPSGRRPTTHILKPPSGELDGHIENEHCSLELARRLGLPTATSRVMHFGDELAIVVERYDRVRVGATLVRVHQEDVCQALGLTPGTKYESEGGPGARTITDLLREHSRARDADVDTFVDALAFNWLVAGTDAHAKNYSILIGDGGRARLAPLYDLASALPYPSLDPERMKLAMKLGGEYRLRNITRRHWVKLATELHLDADATLARAQRLATALPDAATDVARRAGVDGLSHAVVDRLTALLVARAQRCLATLRA
ncbi:MAG TPA: type II toxin-antitoxin system HipA family toxin [Candidatus Binatia bacterium]|nr:type II toxin-antitoxin system HipA family toxin [Candidatus Binatia bacterium]